LRQHPQERFAVSECGLRLAALRASNLTASSRSSTGGSLKWVAGDGFSLFAPAAIADETAIAGSGGVARAYDRLTGAATTFYSTGATGGSTSGISFDAVNHRIFVNAGFFGLHAYQYNSPTSITSLWDSRSRTRIASC
jgi:hypothetical protein